MNSSGHGRVTVEKRDSVLAKMLTQLCRRLDVAARLMLNIIPTQRVSEMHNQPVNVRTDRNVGSATISMLIFP